MLQDLSFIHSYMFILYIMFSNYPILLRTGRCADNQSVYEMNHAQNCDAVPGVLS